MTFKEILHKFRSESFTEKEKGTRFEQLMRLWLMTDPRYKDLFTAGLDVEGFSREERFGRPGYRNRSRG
jgi:predicted helicase